MAYLLGLEGIALLHAFAGEYDRDFTLDRLAEIRALLAAGEELGDGALEAGKDIFAGEGVRFTGAARASCRVGGAMNADGLGVGRD